MIHLSISAANEIRRLQHSRSLKESYFRVAVQPGGCAGLYYTFELSQTPQAGDRLCTSQEINILIAGESEPLLRELHLDYAEDLMGGGFRFHNPKASSTCGCGLSFTLESGHNDYLE